MYENINSREFELTMKNMVIEKSAASPLLIAKKQLYVPEDKLIITEPHLTGSGLILTSTADFAADHKGGLIL